MALPDGYRMRPLTELDKRAALEIDTWAFPSAHDVDAHLAIDWPLPWDRFRGICVNEPDATAVPIDGARPASTELIALHGSYEFDRFPVPGAEIPAAGLTWVGVHPAHRRRGLLRSMMSAHFADCRDRGEVVSALFAAEASIYGRFGYGLAAYDVQLTIARGAKLRPVPGAGSHAVRIETLSLAAHGELVEQVHREAGRRPLGVGAPHGALLNRPGWVGRDQEGMAQHYLADPPLYREGREPKRIVIVERDGEPRGYAIMQRTSRWSNEGPHGTVHASEVVALDPGARHDLWSVLLDLDLTHEVSPFILAPDDAVLNLLENPRSARAKIADNVWVRLVDVIPALAARRYAANVDVVVHVVDDVLAENTGSYRIRAQAFAPATVTRTDDAADLTLDMRTLSAAYLGGQSLAALAGAGHVTEHSGGALAVASAAFAWPVAPSASWIF